MKDNPLSEQLDKASAQLKRLSVRASAGEADANALKAKNKAALEQKVNAAQADAKQASDDLKASAKQTQDEVTQWWGQVQDNWKSHIAKVRKNAEQNKANMKADRAEDTGRDSRGRCGGCRRFRLRRNRRGRIPGTQCSDGTC